MDVKSIIFFITFVIAGILVLSAVYAVSFLNMSVTTPKVYMDIIFAVVLAIMSVLQYKVLETTEKA